MTKQKNEQSTPNSSKRRRATLVGFIAIVLWATLALLTSLTNKDGGMPPFQLLFLSFFIGASVNTLWLLLTKQLRRTDFAIPVSAWALSVGGLFFYHFFYFNALSRAPEIEAGLIAYLWPLLIVLFSALLPGEQLRWYHVLGALFSFCGAAALILLKDNVGVVGFDPRYVTGYVLALLCALTWSLYSVFNRHFSGAASSATVGFCYAVAFLAVLAHLLSDEVWATPTLLQWIGIVGLGIGPVGLAFFVWDYGTKHGNIQLLGILSYFAPLLSTLLLIMFTDANLSRGVIIGCCAIVVGAMVAVLPESIKR